MNDLLDTSKFKGNTHRPCFWFAIASMGGICLGRFFESGWSAWSVYCGVFLMLSLLRGKISIFFLYLSVIGLGAFYYQSVCLLPANHIRFLSYQEKRNFNMVEGVIDSDVQVKPTTFGTKQVFELEVSKIKMGEHWQAASGRILVHNFKPFALSYGDHVRLQGTLYKPFSNPSSRFSYQRYLEDHGIFLNMSVGRSKSREVVSSHQGHWLFEKSFEIKHKLKGILAEYLEPQEANMIQAMVLGDRSFMTKDVYALFSKTGTSHILAISGMNMTLISAIVLFIFKTLSFPRSLQFVMTGIFLLMYSLISGLSASVVRSVLMAIVLLSSFCLEHETDTVNSLGLAALILLAFNPLNLFDLGFQLSFICVLILAFFYPLINPIIQNCISGKVTGYLAQAFAVSLVAWVGITAIIAYEYEIVSPIAIIANIVIVPLADLTIALSLGVAGFGLFWPAVAFAFAGSLKAVFNLMMILISWFAQVPGGYFYIHQVEVWQVFTYYLFLIAAYVILSRFVQNKIRSH